MARITAGTRCGGPVVLGGHQMPPDTTRTKVAMASRATGGSRPGAGRSRRARAGGLAVDCRAHRLARKVMIMMVAICMTPVIPAV